MADGDLCREIPLPENHRADASMDAPAKAA
jgi:hypothetical protein